MGPAEGWRGRGLYVRCDVQGADVGATVGGRVRGGGVPLPRGRTGLGLPPGSKGGSVADEDRGVRRRPWTEGPEEPLEGPVVAWLFLSDDDLLFRIEALPPDHDKDAVLLQVVRSNRHFFIRQEAAKQIREAELLKDHSGDRHIGQILVWGMIRA